VGLLTIPALVGLGGDEGIGQQERKTTGREPVAGILIGVPDFGNAAAQFAERRRLSSR
jgi:hypothetical protein